MTLNWNEDQIVVITEAENAGLFQSCGFSTVNPPGIESVGLPQSDHFIVACGPQNHEIGHSIVEQGACKDWQVTLIPDQMTQLHQAFAENGPDGTLGLIKHSGMSLRHEEEHRYSTVERRDIQTYKSGFEFMDRHLRYTDEGELNVTVGPSGAAKSALGQIFACDHYDTIGRERGWNASICGWEDPDHRIRRNIERFAETRERNRPIYGGDIERRQQDLVQNIHDITRRPGEDRLFEWYLDMCDFQVRRYNCKYFVFDPWNQHDYLLKSQEAETEYVRRMLKLAWDFAHEHKVIMNIVTHVTGASYSDEGKVKPFTVAQAHGSKEYRKKADRGFCVSRTRSFICAPNKDRMILRFDKNKDEETMGDQTVMALIYDRNAMDLIFDADATREVKELWA